MVGIIVTGHGGFASGLEKNVKMLAGDGVEMTAIDFVEGLTPEELDEKLKAALDKYAACDCTIIACDLAGGTPYNRAVLTSVAYQNARVLSGANTPLLLDLTMRNVTEEQVKDVDVLAEELMTSGREGIGKFVFDTSSDDMEEDGDGI